MKNIKVVVLLLSDGFFENCGKKDDIVYYELQEALKNANLKFMSVTFNGFSYNCDTSTLFDGKEIDRFKHINAMEYHSPYSFDFEKLIGTICSLKGDYVDTDKINRLLMKVINRTLGESSDIQLNRHTFSVHKTNPSAQESRLVAGDSFEIMTNTLTYDLDSDSIFCMISSHGILYADTNDRFGFSLCDVDSILQNYKVKEKLMGFHFIYNPRTNP